MLTDTVWTGLFTLLYALLMIPMRFVSGNAAFAFLNAILPSS